jgi:hypothetical protein
VVQRIAIRTGTCALKNAIDEFYAYRRGKDNGLALGAEEALYETATFSVCRVPHFAEVRYGVHFKDTDEFGLYGMFVFDEPDKEPHSHFHRSDAGFEKESYLDDILIDEPELNICTTKTPIELRFSGRSIR